MLDPAPAGNVSGQHDQLTEPRGYHLRLLWSFGGEWQIDELAGRMIEIPLAGLGERFADIFHQNRAGRKRKESLEVRSCAGEGYRTGGGLDGFDAEPRHAPLMKRQHLDVGQLMPLGPQVLSGELKAVESFSFAVVPGAIALATW